MKHTAALSSVAERITEDLQTNEKQLVAAQEKLAKLQHRQNDLRSQLGRTGDVDGLQDGSCPECYANSGANHALQQRDDEHGGKLACPSCNWIHVEVPQEPQAAPQQF